MNGTPCQRQLSIVHLHLGQRLGAPGRVHAVLLGVVRDLPAVDGTCRVAGPAGAVRGTGP